MKFACQELEQLFTLVFTFEEWEDPRAKRVHKLVQTALADLGLESLESESIPANPPVATAVPQ